MNSIAHATGTIASTPAARVTPIEEVRAEHDQGYFFRLPDWLADQLCAHHASGAAWALVTLVGRKTRWGQHVPQRITVPEMLGHTEYARQTITDALACLVGWGVLYAEHEPDRRYVRYALVDLTACSGPYEDEQGAARIDLLEHPAYPITETSLKTRPMALSRYRSKKQADTSLKSANNQSKKQTDISLKPGLVVGDQPPLETAPAVPIDAREIIKDYGEEEIPPQHTLRLALSETEKAAVRPSHAGKRSEHLQGSTSAEEDPQALLAEAASLLKELRKSPGWEEAGGEAVPKLDTLLRVKRYPLDWLIDEAIAYGGYRTKTGTHSWAGFLQWCNPIQNAIAGKRLAAYRAKQATPGQCLPSMASTCTSPSYLQHASRTEQDRQALAASRASRAAYLATPHEKPDYLR